MKKLTATFLSLFLMLSLNVLASPDTVEMQDNVFVPDSVTITEGDTIVWINTGGNNHTSTSGTGCSQDGTWNSGTVAPGGEFMYTFDTTGEFPYYCIPHCALGMTGHVTVEMGPVGTQQILAASQVDVFPNPVNDQLQVDLSRIAANNVAVKVYDVNGKQVLSKAFTVSKNKLVIDTSPWRQGLYLVKLTVDGQSVAVEKISKL